METTLRRQVRYAIFGFFISMVSVYLLLRILLAYVYYTDPAKRALWFLVPSVVMSLILAMIAKIEHVEARRVSVAIAVTVLVLILLLARVLFAFLP